MNVLYTVITGGYDTLHELDVVEADVRYVCLTDNPLLRSKTWEIIEVNTLGYGPAKLNRFCKFFPHKFFPLDNTIYIDGNINTNGMVSGLFKKYNALNKFALPMHYLRDCVYDEAIACLEAGKIAYNDYLSLLKYYANKSWPIHNGLTENNIIYRPVLTNPMKAAMDEWFRLYCELIARDQLTLPLVLNEFDIQTVCFDESPRYCASYFRINFHNSERVLPFLKKVLLYCRLNSGRSVFAQLIVLASKFIK